MICSWKCKQLPNMFKLTPEKDKNTPQKSDILKTKIQRKWRIVSCKLNLRTRDRIVDASCTSYTRQRECNGKSYSEMQCEMVERVSYDLEKWFRKVFVICFISQWMERSKHGLFVFPPKKTLIWRRHCSICQSCCSMTSNWSINLFLESSRAWSLFNQGPVTRSLVSANRWLRGIKMYRFPWYLTLVSTNHASSNPGQTVRLTNQKQRTFCIRSTNQSNRSISVRLLLLCCSRVFISRLYENRSIQRL